MLCSSDLLCVRIIQRVYTAVSRWILDYYWPTAVAERYEERNERPAPQFAGLFGAASCLLTQDAESGGNCYLRLPYSNYPRVKMLHCLPLLTGERCFSSFLGFMFPNPMCYYAFFLVFKQALTDRASRGLSLVPGFRPSRQDGPGVSKVRIDFPFRFFFSRMAVQEMGDSQLP